MFSLLTPSTQGPRPKTRHETKSSTTHADLLRRDHGRCIHLRKGLAVNAVLPATLADVAAALRRVLAVHLPTLDLHDENSRQEHAAYPQLITAYDDIAGARRGAAEQIAVAVTCRWVVTTCRR